MLIVLPTPSVVLVVATVCDLLLYPSILTPNGVKTFQLYLVFTYGSPNAHLGTNKCDGALNNSCLHACTLGSPLASTFLFL